MINRRRTRFESCDSQNQRKCFICVENPSCACRFYKSDWTREGC